MEVDGRRSVVLSLGLFPRVTAFDLTKFFLIQTIALRLSIPNFSMSMTSTAPRNKSHISLKMMRIRLIG